jgi:hypothetical protein
MNLICYSIKILLIITTPLSGPVLLDSSSATTPLSAPVLDDTSSTEIIPLSSPVDDDDSCALTLTALANAMIVKTVSKRGIIFDRVEWMNE